ncbi:hypothetical protein COP2_029674 [Malus domestica]
MAPDCDISVLDGLKYVSRFGIPLKKYWKTGQKAPNIPQESFTSIGLPITKVLATIRPPLNICSDSFHLFAMLT